MRVIDLCGRIRVNNFEVDATQFLDNDYGGNWRVRDNNQFQIYDATTAGYYTIFVTGAIGAEMITIGAKDATALTIYGHMKKNPPGGTWRVNDLNQFQIYSYTTKSYYTLFVSGAVGFEMISIGESDTSVSHMCGYMDMNPIDGGWRVRDGNLQIPNHNTSLWHTLIVSGAAGAEQIAIGPGET